MENGRKIIEVLASKRLTKSFTRIDSDDIWVSMSLTENEANNIIANAIKKMSNSSDPLTITITVK